MADVPAYLEELVETVGRANHNFFQRRGQSQYAWEELPPIYRHTAKQSHFEILMDGPLDLIEREIKDAHEQAPVLRLRLEMFINELRAQPWASAITLDIADKLEVIINEPLGG